MVDQRNPQLIAFRASRWFGWPYVINETGGWLPAAGEFHAHGIEKAARLRGIRIEEALPVKVLRKRRCAGAMLHEPLFYLAIRAAALCLPPSGAPMTSARSLPSCPTEQPESQPYEAG
jgi:hypothetical protein